MNEMKDCFCVEEQQAQAGDYRDEEGFLCCGKCHTRKETEVFLPVNSIFHGGTNKFPVACRCEKEVYQAQKEAEERREFQRRMERLQKDGITDSAYLKYTFAEDDKRNAGISKVCQRYVDQWEEMKKNNIGMLFYGDVGTGKSFFACCIANALLEKLVSVSVTNFPRILNSLQNTFVEERQQKIDQLQRYSLLVIDDLGVERDTAYSVEQIYNVIDTRARAGKPLIVTTNLSLKEMQQTSHLAYERIYDRVLELCPIRLKVVGESRRGEKAAEKREKARALLGMGDKS